jgi:hypothetical protein
MHPQPSKNPKMLLNQLKWEIINKSLILLLSLFSMAGWYFQESVRKYLDWE